MARLTGSELKQALEGLADWRVEENALRKEFKFKTFREAMAFINAVAEIARASRHHPEIWNSYNRVRLALTTHDEGGISEKDVEFAQRVEEMRSQA